MEIKIINKGRILSESEMKEINGGRLFDGYKCKDGFFSTPECVILFVYCGNFRHCAGIPSKDSCGGQGGSFVGPYECTGNWKNLCSTYLIAG